MALWGRFRRLDRGPANGRYRRTAADRRQAETFLERPVFGIERPLSNAWGIRGSCGRNVAIERRRGHAEAVRDLGHADVGIGQQRLGGLDVVVGEFRRPASGAAGAPRGGKARLGALPDQTALEFR
jgi:hypothetical protein